jgi:2,3-bisphosphoglycerate-dependent phosphoglycerate mutase
MDLLIIRHAQSSNNALADQSQRVCDPLLTEVGRRQSDLLAVHLAEGPSKEPYWPYDPTEVDRRDGRGYHLARLYCSPMRRALQTAGPIGRDLGLAPHVWVDIHEAGGMWLDHGAPLGIVGYPGITRPELEAQFPGYVVPDNLTDAGWWSYAGQEDNAMAAVRAGRVADTLRDWATRDERIAIITHGAFSDFLLRNLLSQPPMQPVFYHLNNTSISLLRFRANGEISIRYLNRLEHLPPELIT